MTEYFFNIEIICFQLQEEFGDNKGVITDRTPETDRHEEFGDTKGVIRGRTPKKDTQEELEDTK